MVIIGTGNVARNLFDAFRTSVDVNVMQVMGRKKQALSYFNTTKTTSDPKNIAAADIYIIAINDDVLSTVDELFDVKDKFLVHCSGAMPVTILPAKARRGSLYPLQTFTAGRKISLREVPFCLEAEYQDDLYLLTSLASSISDHVRHVTYHQRQALHLAAVFSNNFTNHLYSVAREICVEQNVPFELLHPLIKETAAKINQMTPEQAQTGPARRGDRKTQAMQLNLLKNKEYRKLYRFFTKGISGAYRAKNEIAEKS